MNTTEDDLTSTISKYLDPHMLLPILDFLEENKIQPTKAILQAKMEVVEKTKMVDYLDQLHQELHKTPYSKEEIIQRRDEAQKQLKQSKASCGPLLTVLEDEKALARLKSQSPQLNNQYLSQEFNVTEENINSLYRYARLSFDIGQMEAAAERLFYYRLMSQDEELCYWALWGELAAEIVLGATLSSQRLESALHDLELLLAEVDKRQGASPLVQLEQRTWLLHWSLFIYNKLNKPERLVQLFMQDKLLNALQLNAPHLLRYLVASTVLFRSNVDADDSRTFQRVVDSVMSVVKQEKSRYVDPFTTFFWELYREFDVDAACEALFACHKIMERDYFLIDHAENFLINGRLIVFEMIAKLYAFVDITTLAKQLRLSGDIDAIVVNFTEASGVQNVRVDTSKGPLFKMNTQKTSVYQQVLYRSDTDFHSQRSKTKEIESFIKSGDSDRFYY